jgi:hypothetical protein
VCIQKFGKIQNIYLTRTNFLIQMSEWVSPIEERDAAFEKREAAYDVSRTGKEAAYDVTLGMKLL